MRNAILLLAVLSLAVFASAYENETSGGALCGAPVPTEYTLSGLQAGGLAVAFVIGLAALAAAALNFKPLAKYKTTAVAAAMLLCIGSVGYYFLATPGYNSLFDSFGKAGSVHYHANLLVMINGKQLNLSQDKYMSTLSSPKSMFVHVHDGEGSVIHYHAPNVPLWYFFHISGMSLTSSCLQVDDNTYCSDSTHVLELFVNGGRVQDLANYVARDMHTTTNEDKLLLWYGPDDAAAIAQAESQVANHSCWYDETCPLPEGVTLPPESCSSG
jgi:hypothetical protein